MHYFIGEWYADNAIMTTYLDEMKIVSGTTRNKLLYVNKKIGGSALFGVTWRPYLSPTKNRTPSKKYKNLCNTKLVDDHPYMEEVFAEFVSIYFPDFFYTQIMINKNYQIPPHFDSANVGESVLCAFGDYDGGEINIDFGEGLEPLQLDPQEKPVRFNGSKYKHWVSDYNGLRYSLVFFNDIKNIDKKIII
tara:strand:- start:4866 stop:5438 length:573 start_codon:yes stop_codon:yes gene_type:complete